MVLNLNLFFSDNKFVGSYNDIMDLPTSNIWECCFAGRSNVGKSSIINAITKNKYLANTSKTPGRTQNLNVYQIKEKINVIDLPGYGYAKVSKVYREQLSNLIDSYIKIRKNLKIIYLLIDCKVGLKNSDIDILDVINDSNKKFTVIITKIDKCSPSFINKQIDSVRSFMKNYEKNFTNMYSSSSLKNKGIVDIQKNIYNLSK